MTPKVAEPEYAYSGGSCTAKRGKPAGLRIKGRRPSLTCRRPRRQMSERQASGAVKQSDSSAERRIHHKRSPPPGGRCIRILTYLFYERLGRVKIYSGSFWYGCNFACFRMAYFFRFSFFFIKGSKSSKVNPFPFFKVLCYA